MLHVSCLFSHQLQLFLYHGLARYHAKERTICAKDAFQVLQGVLPRVRTAERTQEPDGAHCLRGVRSEV